MSDFQLEGYFKQDIDEETRSFLFGNCEFLACEINRKFGYQIEAVMTCHLDENEFISLEDLLMLDYEDYLPYTYRFYENDIDYDINIIHCYNTFEENGTKYFVDARGITSDREAFFAPYKGITNAPVFMSFVNEQDIRSRFFSTYYDWYDEEDFSRLTKEHRSDPAIKYVQNNAHLFQRKTAPQSASLDDKIKAASPTKAADKSLASAIHPGITQEAER